MAVQDDIDGQRELLNTHRRTLKTLLKQQAQLGSAYAPPGVADGIREARDGIAKCKKVLRGWGVEVEDHPDDEDINKEHTTSTNKSAKYSINAEQIGSVGENNLINMNIRDKKTD